MSDLIKSKKINKNQKKSSRCKKDPRGSLKTNKKVNHIIVLFQFIDYTTSVFHALEKSQIEDEKKALSGWFSLHFSNYKHSPTYAIEA